MKNFYLFLVSLLISFVGVAQCDYTLVMTDSWGDGWNGASITVTVNGNSTNVTCAGASTTSTVATEDGAVVTFDWNAGSYDNECSVTITAPDGTGIYQGGSFSNQITDVSNAPGCEPPPLCAQSGVEADGIVVDIIMTDSYADGWDGASISVCIDGNTDYTSSFTSGGSDSHSFTLSEGQVYNISYAQGNYEAEHSYTVSVDGVQVLSSGTAPPPGVSVYGSYCVPGDITGVLSACQSSTSQLSFSGEQGGTWSSSDASVASVNESGVVSAVAPGSADITYTASPTGSSCIASSTVTFNTLSAPSAGTLTASSLSFNVSQTSQVSSDGNTGGSWSSGSTNVATVDASTGLVTGVAAGTAAITYTVSAAGCQTVTSTIDLTVNACPSASAAVCSYSSGTALASDMAITNVAISNISNSSGGGDYTNYFCTVDAIELDQATTYTLTLDRSTAYAQYYYVAIDWDQDGTFDGTNEWQSMGAQTTAAQFTYDISVPGDAEVGLTTMRVFSNYFESTSACGDQGPYGDCEDYLVNVNLVCQAITVSGDQNACEGGTGQMTADLYSG